MTPAQRVSAVETREAGDQLADALIRDLERNILKAVVAHMLQRRQARLQWWACWYAGQFPQSSGMSNVGRFGKIASNTAAASPSALTSG